MAARILIIEDNANNLELMSYLLRAFGYEVAGAVDGPEGLAAARARPPDLVLCDLQLPGMDGFHVARGLRESPWMRGVPLLAVTAFAMTGDRERVLGGGFDGHIPKPIDPATFVGEIEAFLPEILRTDSAKHPAMVAPVDPEVPGTAGPPDGEVLVVDDVPANQTFVRAVLEPHGIRVRLASRVAAALAEIRILRPGLVLSDVHLGRESGFDLLRQLRSDPALRKTPFVFLSATGRDPRVREAAIKEGADGYLLNPVDPAALLRTVRDHLSPKGG